MGNEFLFKTEDSFRKDPERLWRIFEAKYVDDLDVEEISAREGISRVSIMRALNKARQIITEHYQPVHFTREHHWNNLPRV